MKKIITIFVIAFAFFAKNTFAQDIIDKQRLSQLLTDYLSVKDALVEDNTASVASGANSFIKTINGISYKIISEGNVNALLRDAGAIANAKDISAQRQYFSNFSDNMYALVKGLKLTDQAIYKQYCPMKKMYWLSTEKTVRNPYYGSAMLSCGKVVDTIQ